MSTRELDSHIIVGKQKTWKKIIEWILTILGWMILFTYVGYVIYGSLAIRHGWFLPENPLFNREMLSEAKKYYFIVFVVLLAGFVLFILWKNYNKRRFGSLNRRKFRPEVTKEELVEKFAIDRLMVETLQNDRIITLEKNIIPEKMGMKK